MRLAHLVRLNPFGDLQLYHRDHKKNESEHKAHGAGIAEARLTDGVQHSLHGDLGVITGAAACGGDDKSINLHGAQNGENAHKNKNRNPCK